MSVAIKAALVGRVRNPQREFARKSAPEPQFPANPIAENCPIFLITQAFREISRSTKYAKVEILSYDGR